MGQPRHNCTVLHHHDARRRGPPQSITHTQYCITTMHTYVAHHNPSHTHTHKHTHTPVEFDDPAQRAGRIVRGELVVLVLGVRCADDSSDALQRVWEHLPEGLRRLRRTDIAVPQCLPRSLCIT
eukprot:1158311-Pelagomonas_calceolata.AAC.18